MRIRFQVHAGQSYALEPEVSKQEIEVHAACIQGDVSLAYVRVRDVEERAFSLGLQCRWHGHVEARQVYGVHVAVSRQTQFRRQGGVGLGKVCGNEGMGYAQDVGVCQ